MARMTVSIEVDLLEDDADCQGLAERMVADLQERYCYLDVELVEVDGPELSL